ncbi:MAG: ATP-dependent DNA helicase, partial [Deltaproteobacteria bacterium]|nr:ATP-dependent DNA helicase [Deltaproteobacteria bacterium]
EEQNAEEQNAEEQNAEEQNAEEQNAEEQNAEEAEPKLLKKSPMNDEDKVETDKTSRKSLKIVQDDSSDDDESGKEVVESSKDSSEQALEKPAPYREPRVKRLLLPSPFDYAEKAALYAPKDMPVPNAANYLEHFDDESKRIIELAQGGTLLLFTSHRAMQDSFERLKDFLEEQELEGLIQGDAPKLRLLERMMELDELALVDPDAECKGGVLFATQSFWEGVDLRGRSLRAVIIDKLPFKSPKDPINQARLELAESRGKRPFFDLSVPEAALSLKQGAGRLMRDVDDAGVVAILDGRLRQKSYGRIFLNTLPPFIRIGSATGLERFWEARVAPWLASLLPESSS